MKRRSSSFLAGSLTTVLVSSLVISALAISGRMTIEVDPVNVQVNGEVFQPKDAKGNDVPVFAYEGTTYAPLRALAEAYGLEVGYDATSNMATVDVAEAPSDPQDTQIPDDTLHEVWTAEDEALYQELTDGWEFTLIGELTSTGVGIDRAAYEAKYTKGEFVFDWTAFEKAENFERVSLKLVDTVNQTGQPNTTIVYGNGIMLFVYDGWVHL